jgi:hypothetical protein
MRKHWYFPMRMSNAARISHRLRICETQVGYCTLSLRESDTRFRVTTYVWPQICLRPGIIILLCAASSNASEMLLARVLSKAR